MKNIVKKILATGVFAILCAGTGAFASGLDNNNAIGIYGIGSEIGVGGIQYERRFSDLFSTKFGVFAFYNEDSYSDPYNMNVTVETDFTLFESDWKDKICSRLFAYGLVGYTGRLERSYEYMEPESKRIEKMHNNAVASLGFGFDFIFFEHLSVPVQFGFMGTFPDDPQVSFCGGIGIRYSW